MLYNYLLPAHHEDWEDEEAYKLTKRPWLTELLMCFAIP
jgi:hypothetical protein